METLKEMMEERRDQVFYNVVMRDDIIGEAFSFDAHADIPEAIARMRYALLQYMQATDANKKVIAKDMGEWVLETAQAYVNMVAENEY